MIRCTFLLIICCSYFCAAQNRIEPIPQIPHDDVVLEIKMANKRQVLVSKTYNELKLWDYNRKALSKTIPLNTAVTGLSLDDQWNLLYLETLDSLFVMRLDNFSKSGQSKKKFSHMRFTNARSLYVATNQGITEIGLFNLKDSLLRYLAPQLQAVTCATTSDLKYLALCDSKGKILVFNGETLAPLQEFSAIGNGDLILNAAKNMLVWYNYNGFMGWDLLTGKQLFSQSRKINSLTLSEELPLLYCHDYDNGYVYNYSNHKTQTIPNFSHHAAFAPGTSNLLFIQDGFPAEHNLTENSTTVWRSSISTRPIDFNANTFFTFYRHDEQQKYISFNYTTLQKNILKNPGPILCFDLEHSKVMGQGYQILEADDLSKVEKLDIVDLKLKKDVFAEQKAFDFERKQILFSTFSMYPKEGDVQPFILYDYGKKQIAHKFTIPFKHNALSLNYVDWKKNRALFSTWPNGSGEDGSIKLLDVETNNIVLDLTGLGTIYKSLLTPDSKYLIVPYTPVYTQHFLFVFDAQTGKEVLRIPYPSIQPIDALYWNSAANLLYAGAGDGQLYVWELPSGKLIRQFSAHTNEIRKIAFLNGQLATTDNYTIRFWNPNTYENISTIFLQAEESSWKNGDIGISVFTPAGFYYSDKSRTSNIMFRANGKLHDIAQFDLRYNRPDLVLKQIGLASPELIKSYQKSYEKRLQKLGIVPESIEKPFSSNVPTLKLINQKSYSVETRQKEFSLSIEAKDSLYSLDRINLKVNGVPVFGTTGKSIKAQNSRSCKETLTLELSAGKNRIDISVLNSNGIESLSERLEVTYTPASSIKPVLHLITISVGAYQDSSKNLRYATKDGKDIVELLKQQKNIFSEVKVYSLFDQQATKENILGLHTALQKSSVNDVVLLFVSGHGLLDKDLTYYLATSNVDFSKPSEKGLAYDELETLLDNIPARQKVILLDACHSGEIDKEEILQMAKESSSEDSPISFRDAGNSSFQNKYVGLANSFELSKQLFMDLRKGSGAIVISAAAGVEFAMESSEWQNGAFTYCLLSGLKKMNADKNKDGAIYLSELQDYLYEEVPKLTKGKQQPTSRKENPEQDFRVW